MAIETGDVGFPSSRIGNILSNLLDPSNVVIGVGGTSFAILTERVRIRTFAKTRSTTRDGSFSPTRDDDGYVYGTIQISGLVQATTTIDLLKLVGSNSKLASITIDLTSNRRYTASVKVEAIDLDYQADGIGIPISLFCQISNSLDTNGVATEPKIASY